MIKNFRLYNKPNSKTKLCAISLATLLIAGCLTGCSAKENKPNEIYGQIPTSDNQAVESTIIKKTFEPGEHTISIPINNPTQEIKQFNYYPGYKCIGMSVAYGGGYSKIFDGACLLYINEYPVECISENGTTFTSFGTPLNYENKTNITDVNGVKTFNEGEHIISIPIADPMNTNIQYQYYPGYELIDIAMASYGLYSAYYAGGAILYVNTTPVQCTPTITEEGICQYLTFGTPVELEKTLTKTN